MYCILDLSLADDASIGECSTNYSQFLFAKRGRGIINCHLRMLENAFPGI